MIGYVTPPGANIFADLGFEPEEAESLFVRAKLMHEMSRMIKERRLKRRGAATLFGVSLQCVDDLKRGEMSAFTIDSLVAMLAHAGMRVKVHVVDIAGEPAGYALQGPAEAEPTAQT